MGTDGLILLDKPAGITSFSVLKTLKSSLGTGHIGHTGTLDKFATGLLVVLSGGYTKLADLFSGMDKSYRATIVLGRTTDTLDPEGQVVEEGPLPELRTLREAAGRLTGTIDQQPPKYSSVHVGGQRAYRIARSGGDPKLESRRVTIYRIEVLEYRASELQVDVDCSKGTYIRALARDLGKLAGSCAYVQNLRRTKVGPYRVEEAVGPDAFSGSAELAGSLQRLSRLEGLSSLTVRDQSVAAVRNGQKLREGFFLHAPNGDGLYALLDTGGALIAMSTRDRGEYRYRMVL